MTLDNQPGDALSDHHVADFKMGGIRLDRIHPRSHVGIERQILRFKQHLILAWLGDGRRLEPKVALPSVPPVFTTRVTQAETLG